MSAIFNANPTRERLIYAVVGSQNYNLATESSDTDVKIFVMPTFEDLYNGTEYKDRYEDIETNTNGSIHCIRKISEVFWKANINFIELLYSIDLYYNSFNKHLAFIFSLKHEIVKMNLPYLYNSCYGNYHSGLKGISKGTENTRHLIDTFGFDTKAAMKTYKALDFLIRFAETNFNDFSSAVRYDNEERKLLLSIKNGEHSEEHVRNVLIADKLIQVQKLESKYLGKEPNVELNENIKRVVKNMVSEKLGIPKKQFSDIIF